MEYTNEKRENKQDNRKNDDITLVQKISLKKTTTLKNNGNVWHI